MKISQIKKANTIEDLKALGIGEVIADIGYRGGGLGFRGVDVAAALDVSANYLPKNYGAGCNYLGGGVRGSVFPSGYSKYNILGRKAKLLDELGAACVRAYINAENDCGLNSDGEDGETNWDAKATQAARSAGTKSAY